MHKAGKYRAGQYETKTPLITRNHERTYAIFFDRYLQLSIWGLYLQKRNEQIFCGTCKGTGDPTGSALKEKKAHATKGLL
jgi:hypothetical protein